MKNRKTHLLALIMLLSMGMGTVTFAQKIPLVYNVENTGIKNPSPNGLTVAAAQPTSKTGAADVPK